MNKKRNFSSNTLAILGRPSASKNVNLSDARNMTHIAEETLLNKKICFLVSAASRLELYGTRLRNISGRPVSVRRLNLDLHLSAFMVALLKILKKKKRLITRLDIQ